MCLNNSPHNAKFICSHYVLLNKKWIFSKSRALEIWIGIRASAHFISPQYAKTWPKGLVFSHTVQKKYQFFFKIEQQVSLSIFLLVSLLKIVLLNCNSTYFWTYLPPDFSKQYTYSILKCCLEKKVPRIWHIVIYLRKKGYLRCHNM